MAGDLPSCPLPVPLPHKSQTLRLPHLRVHVCNVLHMNTTIESASAAAKGRTFNKNLCSPHFHDLVAAIKIERHPSTRNASFELASHLNTASSLSFSKGPPVLLPTFSHGPCSVLVSLATSFCSCGCRDPPIRITHFHGYTCVPRASLHPSHQLQLWTRSRVKQQCFASFPATMGNMA